MMLRKWGDRVKQSKKIIIILSILLIFSVSCNLITMLYPTTDSQSSALVKGISWRPFTSAIKVNTALSFLIIPNEIDVNNLEFQVWVKSGTKDWEVEVPFSKTPIHDFVFDSTGIYNLQVDIRNPKQPDEVQKIWLGQFFVHNEKSLENSDNLIREILAGYSPTLWKAEDIYKPLAHELNIVSNMLIWQYQGYNTQQKGNLLEELSGVTLVKNDDTNEYCYTVENNGKMSIINLENNTIESNDLILKVSLEQHPNIKYVLDNVSMYPDKVKISSIITYLVYNLYDYSQVPYELERPRIPLFSTIAHCGHYTEDLFRLLKELNIPVKITAIRYDVDGVHYVNEVKYDGKVYTLDPTSAAIFTGSVEEIAKSKLEPIVLPQIRDMSFLWSSNMWNSFRESSAYKAYGF